MQAPEGITTLLPLAAQAVLVQQVMSVAHIEGDIAELGVFMGGSAWGLAHLTFKKLLHLFDTFEGMPAEKVSACDRHLAGEFAGADLGRIIELQKTFPNIRIWKGIFPESAVGFDSQLCFVHLDADLYQSTIDGLNLFYPKLNSGGVILLDDYDRPTCPGVKEAVRRFAKYNRKSEFAILPETCQAIIRKPT